MPDPTTQAILQQIGVTVFERGWLSANNILIHGDDGSSALIDSGYCSHATQTKALVAQALGNHPLDLLLNTHLHSDHCGGNSALQTSYPGLKTLIPPGAAQAVSHWDLTALTFEATGQSCPQFRYDGLLLPGTEIALGSAYWQVHGAKGHDPHAIVLFEPTSNVLVSGDALWQNGFGVVFPELEGQSAFDEVAETLDLIESLAPTTVIPGHGPIFRDVVQALQRARSRLNQFRATPQRHLRHAQKVLIKFRLLEWQRISPAALLHWVMKTPYLRAALPAGSSADEYQDWLEVLLTELEKSGALKRTDDGIENA